MANINYQGIVGDSSYVTPSAASIQNVINAFTAPSTPQTRMNKFERGDYVFHNRSIDTKGIVVGYLDRDYVLLEIETGREGNERVDITAAEKVINDYVPMFTDRYCYFKESDLQLIAPADSMKKKRVSKLKLDEEKLTPLVIDPDTKKEIVAVLKQHEHAAKIFEEWGLDEVIEYGKGMTFMFYGSPGTGKTWAANCMAKAMGTELLVIGAAEIQSQEPGGANRNIQAAFAEAKKKHKVLFIDECDSLITTRADVGMILSSEINTLLTEIEKFEGILILATNRIDTMDEALERRISLIVEFPEPDFDMRKKIWTTLLPKKMPIDSKLKMSKLAEFKLTGGQIKNCILQAARLAVAQESDIVALSHFESAISRVLSSKGLMGKTSRYDQRGPQMDKVAAN